MRQIGKVSKLKIKKHFDSDTKPKKDLQNYYEYGSFQFSFTSYTNVLH